MTIDQLMRRMAVQLRSIVEKLEHPNDNDARGAAVMAKSTLDDLHEAAAKLRALELAGQILSAAADAADDDITQHLQVANYNLHGLLNTGDRIDPPNPPHTVHQAGIDASIAVRNRVRQARQFWQKAKEAKPPMEDVDAMRIQRDEAREELERLEASHRMLGDAYDAARQDRDHALAKVARRDAELNDAWSRLDEAEAKVTRLEATLAASRQGPAKASDAPGEGGDSDRRRLEALERYLEGDTFREVWKTSMGRFAAGTKIEGQHFDAPTLAALADKLAAEEAKP